MAKLRERLRKNGLKSLMGNSGYRRFLKVAGTEATVDEDTVKEEERYDGKYVLRTNNRGLRPRSPWPR